MLSPTRARGVPFGWLFLGYANLLYPAGVMGWLSNVFCPPLGLGVSLHSLKCHVSKITASPSPHPPVGDLHFPDWRVLSCQRCVVVASADVSIIH
jgi:hypothetical protein